VTTFEDTKKDHIAKMGEALGTQYSALWTNVIHLNIVWQEYVELFGKKPERIDLLNSAAAAFFRMLQDELFETVLLHLSRLTDPPRSGNRTNLTLRNLAPLIDDAALKAKVTQLVGDAVTATVFCRDWRNRRIAHTDLDLALELPATPLANASRLEVNAAVQAVGEPMRAIHAHYLDSDMRFDLVIRTSGAEHLLYVLRDGLKADAARRKRIESGDFSDFKDFNGPEEAL
jgi:AbiU2